MSMHGRNDRSIHTDAKRIKHSLATHATLTATYIADGMTREEASKRAYRDVTRPQSKEQRK